MINTCIFDLDGTLVDSLEDLANATNYVLRQHQLPTHELDAYNQFVGNGVRKLIERALGDRIDLVNQCVEEFQVYYQGHCLDNTKPYEGIEKLIEQLKDEGYLLGIVTNKPHHLAIKIADTLFPDTFSCIYGQQTAYPTKPDPTSVSLALMQLKSDHNRAIFIGDSDVDMETGCNANMKTIGVLWGFRTKEELENSGADAVADKPHSIKEIINDWN